MNKMYKILIFSFLALATTTIDATVYFPYKKLYSQHAQHESFSEFRSRCDKDAQRRGANLTSLPAALVAFSLRRSFDSGKIPETSHKEVAVRLKKELAYLKKVAKTCKKDPAAKTIITLFDYKIAITGKLLPSLIKYLKCEAHFGDISTFFQEDWLVRDLWPVKFNRALKRESRFKIAGDFKVLAEMNSHLRGQFNEVVWRLERNYKD